MPPRLALIAALCVLAGCTRYGGDPVVGGRCNYETSQFSATVLGHDDSRVALAGPGGDQFFIERNAFRGEPIPGEVVEIEKDSITSGTCVPFMYRVI
jgi:hypothetical protein